MATEHNITGFYTTAQTRDFARQFQFRLFKLGSLTFGDENVTANALVYVETASLPGRSITNVTVPFMGLGFNIPGTATYPGSSNYAVTFRCDQSYDIRAALEISTFNTFNDEKSTGDYTTPKLGDEIIFGLLDKQLNVITKYHLYGAYVVSFGDIGYDIKDTGSVVTLQATLAYQYWRREAKNAETNAKGEMPLVART